MAYIQYTGGERYPAWNSLKENKDFKKGDELEGIYKSKKEISTENGRSYVYAIEKLSSKEMVGVFGTKILDDFFGAMVFGTQVKLTYMGKMKPKKGGREYHGYQCDYDKDTVPEDEDKLIADAAKETFGA